MLKIVYNRVLDNLDLESLERKLQKIWAEESGGMLAELSIAFVGIEEIVELNRKYLERDKPTDVLSFSLLEGVDQPYPEEIEYRCIGDIIICVDVAKEQAQEHRIPFQQEVERLAVHGLLHILGYEHEGVSEKKAKEMREREEGYLRD